MSYFQPIMVLDVQNLAHRAFHGNTWMGDGGYKRVIHGVLVEILQLRKRFKTDKFVFCFDQGQSKRKEIFPDYKKKLITDNASVIRGQIRILKNDVLRKMGFDNIFSFEGYEADDLIARVVYGSSDRFIIVSSDKDLYQLLEHNVNIYNPLNKTLITAGDFEDEYDIAPDQWVAAKSIMGDDSDKVPGIEGVGLMTALSHIKGKHIQTRLLNRIAVGQDVVARNFKLMELPLAGTPFVDLKPFQFDEEKWNAVVRSIGLERIKI
jgi:DNA polymerase I